MELGEIKALVDQAREHAKSDQLGFLVIGFAYSEDGKATNHRVLARAESREDAEEKAGGHFDCAYVLDEAELAFGLIPGLLAELLAAKRSQPGSRREREPDQMVLRP